MLRFLCPFLYVLLPLTYIFANGVSAAGLSCKFCQTVNNYNDCIKTAGRVECNDALVNMTHLLLNPHNPTLGKVVPAVSQYQCFQVNYTINGVWNYHMGCTFTGSKICEGWKVLSQCTVTNGIEGPTTNGKLSGKPTSSVTPTGASKRNDGISPQPSKSSLSPSSSTTVGPLTTTVSIVAQSNGSSVHSTLAPKVIPNAKDSSARKTPSKANVLSLQWEVLAIFWILILFWRHC
uniref:Uncharacterized protein n=1 Tax=Anopheles maculatus TaxID=74869 RepID=A0A182SEJ1_9DIPT